MKKSENIVGVFFRGFIFLLFFPLAAKSTPLRFEKNIGQVKSTGADSIVRFILRAESSTYYFFDYGYSIVQHDQASGKSCRIDFQIDKGNTVEPEAESADENFRFYFGAAQPSAVFYQSIIYRNAWDGSDLRFSISGDQLVREISMRKNSWAQQFQFNVSGASTYRYENADGYRIVSPLGTIDEVLKNTPAIQPHVFIGMHYHDAEWVTRYTFTGMDHWQSAETLQWLTYLGGGDADELSGIALIPQDQGSVAVGRTISVAFPTTPGVLQDTLTGSYDVTISRFDESGTCLWSTYYGGTGFDGAYAVQLIDSLIVVTGNTNSTDLPLLNASQNSNGGSYDAFLLELNDTGGMVRSTYYGGPGADQGFSLAIDTLGRIVVAGSSTQAGLPLASAGYQSAPAGQIDAFLAVFDQQLQPVWSTYYGGSGSEDIHGVTVTPQGEIAFCGGTFSLNFPTTANAYQPGVISQPDAYFVKFGMDGTRHYSTLLGGTSNEDANAVVSDSTGKVYMVGFTYSADFPITGNTFQSVIGAQDDSYVVCFDTSGQVSWSSYLGGNGADAAWALHRGGKYLYIAGNTESSDFPVSQNAYQGTYNGNSDGYVIKMDTAGNMVSGTFLGGAGVDAIYGITISDDTSAIVCGDTYSNNLPVTNAFQSTYGGSEDGFVAQFSMSEQPITTGVDGALKNNFSVYPNPAVKQVKLKSDETINRVEVIDALGHVTAFAVQPANEVTLDISDLARGVYTLRVYSGKDSVRAMKLVKQ